MIATQKGWKIILTAVFGGLALGTIARLWMRWISTVPEFSWGGTIGIITAFTIFALTQATAYILRRRVKTRRLTSVIRIAGVFFTLPLFTAAGAIMFPTVVLGSIALWQKKIDRKIRFALLIISLIIPVIQIKDIGSDFGWDFPTIGRSLLFILIYTVVILLLKPTLTPYAGPDSRVLLTRRRKKIIIAVVIVLITLRIIFSLISK